MRETVQELSKLASFLGINIDPLLLVQAAERSSADKMRRLENAQARLWCSTKNTRQDVPFVRSAKVGGWRSELPESSVAELEAAWGHLMTWLGYELASDQESSKQEFQFTASVLRGAAQ
jgi:Sulfotransferase domain